MKIVAVIPAYQEEGRIGRTVRDIFPYVDVVVVVDDGSGDETLVQAREAGAIAIRLAINRGQGAALRTGTEAALEMGASIIVHIDADGQHDPSYIPQLIQPLMKGEYDVVFGSRFLGTESEGMPSTRRLLLSAARAFNTLAIGISSRVTDPQSGFRAMTAQAAEQIDFRQDRFAHCSEILRLVTRSQLRWCEVPVKICYSQDSLQKGQKPWDAARIAWQLFLGVFS